MRIAWLLVPAVLLVGCSTPQPEQASAPPLQSQAPVSQNGGEVAPMTTTPIPNAPVTGTESLQGGGSAVGTVAKDRAKEAAGRASNPNMGTQSEGE